MCLREAVRVALASTNTVVYARVDEAGKMAWLEDKAVSAVFRHEGTEMEGLGCVDDDERPWWHII